MNSLTFCRVDVKHFASIQAEFHRISPYKGKISPDVPKLHFNFKSFRVTEVREQELQLLLTDTILALVQKKQPVK